MLLQIFHQNCQIFLDTLTLHYRWKRRGCGKHKVLFFLLYFQDITVAKIPASIPQLLLSLGYRSGSCDSSICYLHIGQLQCIFFLALHLEGQSKNKWFNMKQCSLLEEQSYETTLTMFWLYRHCQLGFGSTELSLNYCHHQNLYEKLLFLKWDIWLLCSCY